MRRAMRSRFWSSERGMGSSQSTVDSLQLTAKCKLKNEEAGKMPALPGIGGRAEVRHLQRSASAALDSLYVVGAFEDCVDIDAGSVDLIGRELAWFDELFDFGDDVIGGG